ncbi:hypothetical protein Dda_1109 [Drechslerella dactyloides]|uniref:Uncharacterized protein n=1 Tax=Drechslerella dactyloides TaxID=74499 RepID=A0AAD6NNX1_DREDA|nr:hypothetical protein Dda_1109 [Drechslerella dactyloides]
MALPRRRFSVFQRHQHVTVGPLGFDVPITTDTTAFPPDDPVDEEDRLSDVDYPDPGHARHAKRQRIEDNARDYLCGKPLDIYTASLRGPVTKSYWGTQAKVTGTFLEVKAAELKGSILTAKREARRQQALRGRQIAPSQEQQQHQVKITSALKATKAVQTPVEKPEELLLVLDSQQAIELSQSQSQRHGSSPPRTAVISDTPVVRSTSVRRASARLAYQIGIAPGSPPATGAGTSGNPSGGNAAPEYSVGRTLNRGTRNSHESAEEQPVGRIGAADESTDDIVIPATSQQDRPQSDGNLITSPRTRSAEETAKAAQNDNGIATKEQVPMLHAGPETNIPLIQAGTADAINFDLNKIDQITRRLSTDDTVNFFQSEAESRASRDHSPSTALKESLPKVGRGRSSVSHAPPSPTADAILRKAQKAPASKRRNNLGNGTSLKDIIARTSRTLQPVRRPRRSQASEDPDVHDGDSKAEAAPVPRLDIPPAAEAVEASEPSAQQAEKITISNDEQHVEEPVVNGAEDTTIVTMPSMTTAQEPPATASKPPIRLSQLPTPLPPSPLQLLDAPKQGTPNIPETVEEESVEKPVPSDMSLKENEPAFKPGPRRAKRTAPRARRTQPPGSQPSSNEELKAAINARKIATPISRLQQKMAEYSPVSPMNQRPVSPIPESQGQAQNQMTSLRRQEQLREEQQKGSSQLSSPPPSSPPEDRAPGSAKKAPQVEAVVQVPASSKDITKERTETAPNSRPVSASAPLSPPQDSHDEESTIEMSSGHYRRIEESLRNAGPIAIPLAAEDGAISHISASHPENSIDISPILPDETLSNAAQPNINAQPPASAPAKPTHEAAAKQPENPADDDDGGSTDSEDLDLPPRKQQARPAVLVPGTPAVPDPNTQASCVGVPESFRKAIAAPIAFTFETPDHPLPPPYIPATVGFTPINGSRATATSPVSHPPASPTPRGAGPFTSPSRCIEFTPFRSFTSPRPAGRARTPGEQDDERQGSALEPTTIISPFAFSQFMKGGAQKEKETQFEVSRVSEGVGAGAGAGVMGKDVQSSYDFDDVLGSVEGYLMSDVYDVEEEAKRMSTSLAGGGRRVGPGQRHRRA